MILNNFVKTVFVVQCSLYNARCTMFVDRLSFVMYDHFVDMSLINVLYRLRLRCMIISLI